MLFLDASINIKDVGAMPAKRVFTSSKTVAGVREMREAWNNSNSVCADAEKRSNDPTQLSPIIFPGPDGIDVTNGTLFAGDASVRADGPAGSKWQIICVVYQEATQEGAPHRTKTLFHAIEDNARLIQSPDVKGVEYKPIARFEIVDAEAN